MIQTIKKEEVFMKRATLLALVLMFTLSGISMAKDPGFAGGSPGPGKESMGIPGGKWWKMPQVARRLVLTQEEKKNLDTMYLQHRYQMIDLSGQVEKERLELEEIFDSSSFDAAACTDRFKKLQEAHKILATERFKFLVQVRELLGLDRFEQLKTEVRRHRMKRKPVRRHPAKDNMPRK
jgi:Spy/CpxP family protein refolding chaperone